MHQIPSTNIFIGDAIHKLQYPIRRITFNTRIEKPEIKCKTTAVVFTERQNKSDILPRPSSRELLPQIWRNYNFHQSKRFNSFCLCTAEYANNGTPRNPLIVFTYNKKKQFLLSQRQRGKIEKTSEAKAVTDCFEIGRSLILELDRSSSPSEVLPLVPDLAGISVTSRTSTHKNWLSPKDRPEQTPRETSTRGRTIRSRPFKRFS